MSDLIRAMVDQLLDGGNARLHDSLIRDLFDEPGPLMEAASVLASVKVRGKVVKAVRKGKDVHFSGSPTGKHSVMDDPPGRWKAHWDGYVQAAKKRLMAQPPRVTKAKAWDIVDAMAKDHKLSNEDPALARAAIMAVLKGASEERLDRWVEDAMDHWKGYEGDLEDIMDTGGGNRRRGRMLKLIDGLLDHAVKSKEIHGAVWATSSWGAS